MDFQDIQYEQCEQIIRKAGQKIKSAVTMVIDEKTDYTNVVTDYDKATQDYLMTELKKVYPTATFLCEEEDTIDLSGEYVFVIDPIDGTANFVKRYNQSAISVALSKGDDLLWGIVYNPFTEELFCAMKGKGAWKNDCRIAVGEDDLNHSLVALGTSPYYKEYRKQTFDLACEIMGHCMDVRRCGSAALDLCATAMGRNGVFFEALLSPWDFAAGMLIVGEAGGIVTDFAGNVPDFTKKSGIVAGNTKAHAQFMELAKAYF